jgi:ABC-type glycerol-3-phosphate transport system substrate-binding protein
MSPSGFVRRGATRWLRVVANPYWLVVGAALALPACASDASLGEYAPSTCDFEEPPSDLNNVLLFVSTFWTDTEEQKALDVLTASIPDEYNYQPLGMQTRADSQLSLEAAFEERRLPDVFQANAGSDVLRWVTQRPPEASAVCELDRLSSAFGWQSQYFPESLEPATCRGHLYALPIGIHKLNVLFFNRELFTRLQKQAERQGEVLREPSALETPEELLEELAQVARLGRELELGNDFVPLAIGAQDDGWPLTVLAFENVLLGQGKEAYRTLWRGGLQSDDGRRRTALVDSLEGMVGYLRALVDISPVDPALSWQDAVRKVGSGRALFTVTGDWGWAQLDESQAARVETVPFPGTSKSFVYTPDSFAVPRELRKSGYRARTFLESVVASKTTLLEFSHVKHSIPPRRGVLPEDFTTPSLLKTYEEFRDCSDGASDCELVLAVSGLGPPPGADDGFDDLDALLTLAVTGDVPGDRERAEQELVDLLLRIGEQAFAADCR